MPEYQDNDDQEQAEIYATLVEINQEPTELYKILKIGNLVSGGGEAKQVISEGYVFLNGEEETRKRKKVYAGDLVSFNGKYLQVALKGKTEEYAIVDSACLRSKNTQDDFENKQKAEQKVKPLKRKPISF